MPGVTDAFILNRLRLCFAFKSGFNAPEITFPHLLSAYVVLSTIKGCALQLNMHSCEWRQCRQAPSGK